MKKSIYLPVLFVLAAGVACDKGKPEDAVGTTLPPQGPVQPKPLPPGPLAAKIKAANQTLASLSGSQWYVSKVQYKADAQAQSVPENEKPLFSYEFSKPTEAVFRAVLPMYSDKAEDYRVTGNSIMSASFAAPWKKLSNATLDLTQRRINEDDDKRASSLIVSIPLSLSVNSKTAQIQAKSAATPLTCGLLVTTATSSKLEPIACPDEVLDLPATVEFVASLALARDTLSVVGTLPVIATHQSPDKKSNADTLTLRAQKTRIGTWSLDPSPLIVNLEPALAPAHFSHTFRFVSNTEGSYLQTHVMTDPVLSGLDAAELALLPLNTRSITISAPFILAADQATAKSTASILLNGKLNSDTLSCVNQDGVAVVPCPQVLIDSIKNSETSLAFHAKVSIDQENDRLILSRTANNFDEKLPFLNPNLTFFHPDLETDEEVLTLHLSRVFE